MNINFYIYIYLSTWSTRLAWPFLGIGAFVIYLGIDAVTSRMNNHDKHAETKESQAQNRNTSFNFIGDHLISVV
ncbi:hypothetical protein GLOIN_2v1726218 [Rhizophagus clarus]|uniref:Uncharacterized protein n=1 Tax=Rhizophagus clarus TaxID=94130 RepID=A0A8H3QC77_9GLOM|nr:hypothetical protein GLOIN_2v1726218 [Rhizophagus clarus]